MGGEESNVRMVALKNWHIILLVVAWSVSTIVSYARLSSQTDDNSRRIQEMEAQHVRKEQFNELREDIIHRLDRIESKVDAERQK